MKDVKAHWPSDVTEVSVDGTPRWILTESLDALLGPPADASVRLLGPFDPYLQLKDRELLVPDEDNRKALWPTLGRPGAVAVGGEIVGLWRPRTSGKKLSVEVTAWEKLPARTKAAIEEQADTLAAFRGQSAGAVTVL